MDTQKTRTIKEVTAEFGEAYTDAKDVIKDKDRLQKEFFALATDTLTNQTLSTKTVEFDIEKYGATNVKEWVAQHHPGWRFVEVHDGKLVIEEDPALLAFSYINPDDLTIYARTTAQGSPMLDDERLKTEDPELWEQISDYPEPWFGLVEGAIKYAILKSDTKIHDGWDCPVDLLYELNPSALAANFLRDQGVERVLRPIEELTDAQLESLQEYLVPSPITVRLVPPRAAKREELEEAGLA